MIVIVEGINNSGKTTLINKLVEDLRNKQSTSIVLNNQIFKQMTYNFTDNLRIKIMFKL